ncbi:MAG: hypothetical protein ACOC01_05555, partial [Bacteroidales bacterium]
ACLPAGRDGQGKPVRGSVTAVAAEKQRPAMAEPRQIFSAGVETEARFPAIHSRHCRGQLAGVCRPPFSGGCALTKHHLIKILIDFDMALGRLCVIFGLRCFHKKADYGNRIQE